MDLNKVSLIGNLIKDPAAKSLPSGTEISVFTVATNHVWKDQETKEKKESVEFHPVVAWGRLAEIINRYLSKGSKVYLEGKLKTRSWQDKNNQTHYKTEVVASELIMLGGGSKKEEKGQDDLAEEEISVEEVPVEETKS
ncbi:MAG: single-stranded DNA-binding protein [Candidatus Komeilibacteria bacterium CG10_big_fil_rev_8_21_14_0_10_41_13]|uniref:Single-stranded DNA-binding protein n=1 Tax=Candidatus Komeilibacteria bacterium CG10_big_fil_rev_8_21_14_0_10_41_13 TaxID=1974476 RepID=A0A2M6WBT6_9BACT|nr:MAG: single-stranded DNA-binding protein [Candidatus Komeilibacteria bacterium CG10_big_fil_rev_8_21_14_0_10_41_13]